MAELETMLDGELVDALDDTIGQKIEDNHREKTRRVMSSSIWMGGRRTDIVGRSLYLLNISN